MGHVLQTCPTTHREKAARELRARFIPQDVTDDASVEAALKEVNTAEGRLDALINNAGSRTTELTGPEALRVFDTNVAGVVRVTQAALPPLRASANPAVVNISSGLGSFWAVTNPQRHGRTTRSSSMARPRRRCRC